MCRVETMHVRSVGSKVADFQPAIGHDSHCPSSTVFASFVHRPNRLIENQRLGLTQL